MRYLDGSLAFWRYFLFVILFISLQGGLDLFLQVCMGMVKMNKRLKQGMWGLVACIGVVLFVSNYMWMDTCGDIISRGGMCFVNWSYYIYGIMLIALGLGNIPLMETKK